MLVSPLFPASQVPALTLTWASDVLHSHNFIGLLLADIGVQFRLWEQLCTFLQIVPGFLS